MLSQQAAGYLSASLTQFTIMGSSAGSLGTQLWANKLLKTVKHKKALVVPDSYSGLFPPGTVVYIQMRNCPYLQYDELCVYVCRVL